MPAVTLAPAKSAIQVPLAHLGGRRTTTSSSSGPLLDARQRPLSDLRISVTDRCNFRCTYCMPRDKFGRDHAFLPRESLLSFEEIARLARVFAEQGVHKIRLTGGEPLMRRHLDGLVRLLRANLADLPRVELTLTTNGALLAKHASNLKAAGLDRITISLDALDEATHQLMSDSGAPLSDVLTGIRAAEEAGFTQLKINMVVKRGVNDHAIVAMARHFRGSGHILRFIEFMDVGATNGWRMNDVLSAQDIHARLHAEFPLQALDRHSPNEVAQRWRYADGMGEVGIISSVTQPFCGDCSRLRLSPEGKLFTCLFASQGTDLMHDLRRGMNDAALTARIRSLWQARGDRYSELRGEGASGEKIEMSYIGG